MEFCQTAVHQAAPTPEGAPLALRVDLDECGTCKESVLLSVTVVSGGTKFRQFLWPEEKASSMSCTRL